MLVFQLVQTVASLYLPGLNARIIDSGVVAGDTGLIVRTGGIMLAITVPQERCLFGGTIRENIAYGRRDASEDEVIRSAEAASADHFVRTLPDGYDTVVGEEASNSAPASASC